jgi:hypothetical protein
MGLDVTWYRDAKLAPEAELDSDGYPVDWDAFVKLTKNPDFPGRCDDVAEGVYSYGDSGGFRAGAYSGYNDWREELAAMAGYSRVAGESPRHAHSNGAWQANGGPFWELINFTDCDGVIGTAVSAKLARDFADWQDRLPEGDTLFAERYAQWRNAFEQAQHGGFVDFH